MTIKVSYSKSSSKKTVTVIAGKAKHEYNGLAEIPDVAREQLSFFGHWEEIVAFLPITAGYNDKAQLQEAVKAAAAGDVRPARALVGIPEQQVICVQVHARPASLSQSEVADLAEHLQGMSPRTFNAINHCQPWAPQDRLKLMRWFDEAQEKGLTLNIVRAAVMLHRTPYAVLCQLVNQHKLTETNVYPLLAAVGPALKNLRDEALTR